MKKFTILLGLSLLTLASCGTPSTSVTDKTDPTTTTTTTTTTSDTTTTTTTTDTTTTPVVEGEVVEMVLDQPSNPRITAESGVGSYFNYESGADFMTDFVKTTKIKSVTPTKVGTQTCDYTNFKSTTIKLGTGSNTGSLEFAFADGVKLAKLEVTATRYYKNYQDEATGTVKWSIDAASALTVNSKPCELTAKVEAAPQPSKAFIFEDADIKAATTIKLESGVGRNTRVIVNKIVFTFAA
ncbi:MAG: hypothetical protein RR734_00325 [Bacilli bacterium]